MEETKISEEIQNLFSANVHLGHRKNRLHPKARKYVYKMINGSAVIDLTLTARAIEKAKNFLQEARKEGKTILVVASKRIASQFAAELCRENNIPNITVKWPPGLLTNFDNIIKNVKRLNELEEEKGNGSWEKFVKHEVVQLEKEINKLKKFYGGISKLSKMPDIVFIVDIKKEKNALQEAKQTGRTIVAILDTNSNPDLVDYPIVGNDDSAGSVEYLLKELLGTYTEKGKK